MWTWIVQNVSEDGKETDLTFTVAVKRFVVLAAIEDHRHTIAYRLSLPMTPMLPSSHHRHRHAWPSGVAKTMFQTLSDKGINIQVIYVRDQGRARADRRGICGTGGQGRIADGLDAALGECLIFRKIDVLIIAR